MQSIAILFALLSSYLNVPTVYAQDYSPVSYLIESKVSLDQDTVSWLATTTEKYADQYGQNAYIAIDIMYCESHFRFHITSPTNDVGLMQINKIHLGEAKKMGLNLYDPEDNIHFGFYLMSIHPDLHDWSASKYCWIKHPISGGSPAKDS